MYKWLVKVLKLFGMNESNQRSLNGYRNKKVKTEAYKEAHENKSDKPEHRFEQSILVKLYIDILRWIQKLNCSVNFH